MSLFCVHKNLNGNKSMTHYLSFKSVLLCRSQFRRRKRTQALSTMCISQMKTLAVSVAGRGKKRCREQSEIGTNSKTWCGMPKYRNWRRKPKKGTLATFHLTHTLIWVDLATLIKNIVCVSDSTECHQNVTENWNLYLKIITLDNILDAFADIYEEIF